MKMITVNEIKDIMSGKIEPNHYVKDKYAVFYIKSTNDISYIMRLNDYTYVMRDSCFIGFKFDEIRIEKNADIDGVDFMLHGLKIANCLITD